MNTTPMRLLPLLLFALPGALFAQTSIPEDEPANVIEITIDGVPCKVVEGGSTDATVGGKTVKVSATVSATKHFNAGAVEFDYPRHYAYEHENSESLEQWTLDGNDMVIMLFAMQAKVATDDFVEQMRDRFGKKNCVVSTTSRRLGSRTLEGKRMKVTLAGSALNIDILELPDNEVGSSFLFIQDLADNGVSDESRQTMDLLETTFSYK